MSGVDNRVVRMEFDNSQFERKMTETIHSLDKLKATLDFSNQRNALKEVGDSANSVKFEGMSNALDNIQQKFSALSVVAIATLTNVAMKAVSVGTQLAKSLSLDQVIQGFQEYETNINSIQTILANTSSKGTGLDDVNKALDELNAYADQTIYNFSEMTRNIGTFTAAGVDLDTSVQSIKGIANLAAISGSNSQQAATAMYQLSQAIATGSVKLMDWNSVVNAGMGGEVFQKALFETGKSMKTIAGVPMTQTFDDWKKAGNSFRGSLESGWLTAEVLTKTLQGFTGDLTEAQIMAMGYTKDQAAEIMKLGQIGKSAATEVKTLTQLIGTVKEAIGSGWAASFRIFVGNFDEAKALFTEISNAIGTFVGKAADARNQMLNEWKFLGGRDTLIQGFRDAITGLLTILKPIKEAFQDIFPPATSKTLLDLTNAFARFTKSIALGGESANRIKSIFSGLFSIMRIGFEVLKGLVGLLGRLVQAVAGASGGFFEGAAGVGDFLTGLEDVLVKGKGIENFFKNLGEAIAKPIAFIKEFKDKLADLFGGAAATGADAMATATGRVADRFESLRGVGEKLGQLFDWLGKQFRKVKDVMVEVWNYISDWAKDLGKNLAEVMGKGDFNAVVDALNVGLLGGIALILRKFFKEGLKLDLGGGFFQQISGTLEQLTGVLKSMQMKIKAEALMKIAIAIGILTASVLVLSMIDSVALTKALTAMAAGFGELVGALAVLNQISTGKGVLKLPVLIASLTLLAGAMVIFAGAMKIFGTMSWEELAKGFSAVIGFLGIMIGISKTLAGETEGLVAAGIAMIAISTALRIMANAVQAFATMSWEELTKGLLAVAGALAIMIGGMQLMPTEKMLASSIGMIAIAIGLRLLAEAVQAFSGMDMVAMGKGFLGIAAGLVIIGLAMNLFPSNMLLSAVALIAVSVAMNILARAVEKLGGIPLGELAKGIGAMAAMLVVLAAGMIAMQNALPGAGALMIAAGALLILTHVMKELGKMQPKEIVIGLLAMAGAIATIGAMAYLLQPVVGALLALGAAMLMIGAAFALFGAGAYLVVKAIEVLGRAGKAGIQAFMEIIDQLILRIPKLATELAKGVIEFVMTMLDAAPVLVQAAGTLLSLLLDKIVELAPKFAQAFVALLSAGLDALTTLYPKIVQSAITFLLTFLQAIRDNIGEVTTVVVDIIVNFVNALAENVEKIVEAGVNLLLALLFGIASKLEDVKDAAVDVILAFISGLDDDILRIIAAGVDFLINFLDGIANETLRIANAAADIVVKLLDGIRRAIDEKGPEIREAGLKLAGAIVNGLTGGLAGKASEIGESLIGSVGGGIKKLGGFLGIHSPSTMFIGIGEDMVAGLTKAFDEDKTAESSMVSFADRVTESFKTSMEALPYAFEGVGEINPVITPVLDLSKVQRDARDISNLIGTAPITAGFSFQQAQMLSHTTDPKFGEQEPPKPTGPTEVKFEQNIHAPTALSTNDIYRQTRSQIALAKEELSIP